MDDTTRDMADALALTFAPQIWIEEAATFTDYDIKPVTRLGTMYRVIKNRESSKKAVKAGYIHLLKYLIEIKR